MIIILPLLKLITQGYVSLIYGMYTSELIDIDYPLTDTTHKIVKAYIIQDIRSNNINNIITNETI